MKCLSMILINNCSSTNVFSCTRISHNHVYHTLMTYLITDNIFYSKIALFTFYLMLLLSKPFFSFKKRLSFNTVVSCFCFCPST